MARPVFVYLHFIIIIVVFINLFSGLRIATVDKSFFLILDPILPNGRVHFWHMLSGCIITYVCVAFIIYKKRLIKQPTTHLYHIWVNRFGYVTILGSILSGWAVYFNLTQLQFHTLHLICAISIIVYLLLHSWIYFLQYGRKLVKRIFFIPLRQLPWILTSSLIIVVGSMSYVTQHAQPYLPIHAINASVLMDIDGIPNEPQWQEATSIDVHTMGGANFVDGQTTVTIKALSNNHETFFLFSWPDPTQSLSHLPLEKTTSGWRVKENGFYNFDEQSHYEDKFAVMLSSTCQHGADNTVHLGKAPIHNKPGNWHGKGYHASLDGRTRDLWHWKAVRTNSMVLADDNFIGPPAEKLYGQRRYSAGYLADGKESGAYVMNWKWYTPNGIEPKRLPIRKSSPEQVLPWFGSVPYQPAHDLYPVGTQLPSVLYRSNRFEGDRADVRAYGRWKEGRWTLELVRKNHTHSKHDVALENGICMWVSAFDHSQIAHTRHNLAIRLRYPL